MILRTIKKELSFSISKKWYLYIMVFLIFSCQSDDDATILPVEDPMNGFWMSEEKGYILELTDDNNIFYNVNTIGCSIQDDDFIPEDYFGLQLELSNENELVASTDLSDSEIVFTRLSSQTPNCLPDQVSSTEDPKVNFDHFWNIFNDHYAFFDTRNVDWSQYEDLRDQVTADNFYDVLEELVVLLEDAHVSVYDEDNDIEINSGEPKLLERLNANLTGELIIESEDDYFNLVDQKVTTIVTEYLKGNFEIDDSENILWGLIDDTVGYIVIGTMEGYGTNFSNELSTLNTVLDTIMNDLRESGVSKLIIDIRFNDGGYDTAALDMVSRFMDQERISYFKKARLGDSFTENKSFSVGPKGDFQFTDDIIVLTSPYSVSAAELFALCVKDLPYVTIVGENTAGAFSTILTHILPNGAEVGLSNEVYSDAQGEVFEAVGIGPENQENRMPFLSTLDFQEEKDGGIERALELLNN
ncbi:Peptidase family S41 [Aquimarina amphilecti]|uniref:Peptidase family S41 n=1 Tax=Aquimarina amphilecti TaxID=1038014 RepID=A0A1H7S5D6_AQUAM|nr:S41 family peptidase [Aquimarina amphilecti]SEL67456.1 Peptidase family S41 [Aquimarina amphilecti]